MKQELRGRMESSFGEDFSDVDVQRVDDLGGPLALTRGNTIEMTDAAMDNDFILAHELAHVVQQRNGKRTGDGATNDVGTVESDADAIAARVTRGEAVGPIAGTSVQQPLAFAAWEHQRMGNEGAMGANNAPAQVELCDGYRLDFGDVVALAGDHFSSIAQMQTFAKNESGGANSRQEIEYARMWKLGAKVGFVETDADWKAAKASQEKRYYLLAGGHAPGYGGNASHFLNPVDGDMSRSTYDKALDQEKRPDDQTDGTGDIDDWTKEWGGVGAAGGYRHNHASAIIVAAMAGKDQKPIAEALAYDAFACHYLTDAFSGGHIRTPRQSINEYWDPKVPMFPTNIIGYMSEQIANYLISNGLDVEKELWDGKIGDTTIVDGGWSIYPDADNVDGNTVHEEALSKVKKLFAARAQLTFGDVVSLAMHDYDNVNGVHAHVDGERMKLYGDGKAYVDDDHDPSTPSKANWTSDAATQAVSYSVHDIYKAKELGETKEPTAVLVELSDKKDHLFRAEKMIPTMTEEDRNDKENPEMKWKFSTPQALLADSRMQEALKVFLEEKAGDLDEVKADLGEGEAEAVGALADKMTGDPQKILTAVINWTPDHGSKREKQDHADEYFRAAQDLEGGLASLTVNQRQHLIVDMVNGDKGTDTDYVLELLRGASPEDRRWIIESIEWKDLDEYFADAGDPSEFRRLYPKDEYT